MKPLSSPGELTVTILRITGGTGTSTTFSDMEFAIKARDEEIIAWAEAEKENTVTGPNGWPRLALLDRLIDSLRGKKDEAEPIDQEEWIGKTVKCLADDGLNDSWCLVIQDRLRALLPLLKRGENVR